MKTIQKLLLNRVVIVGLLLLIQLSILLGIIWKLSQYFVYIQGIFVILSLGIVIWLVSKEDNPSVKIPWIIVIMLVPIFGGLFYLMFGSTKLSKKQRYKIHQLLEKTKSYCHNCETTIQEIENKDRRMASQCRYIYKETGMPVYDRTKSTYLNMGEVKFEAMKRELEKAKHFIFMEYFIIEEGIMWDSILEILVRKAKEGVEVRVMYDDIGCSQTLPYQYDKKLEEQGIKCVVFNPFVPFLSTALQNRDHRKITVIDGYIGFTGGVNLADEYINAYEKHGHWKDCGVLLEGEAVWSLTLLFLENWNHYRPTDTSYEMFKPHAYHKEDFEGEGYVQPFGDTPLDGEYVGESVYLNIINQATDYIYINTPYLIVDNELMMALKLAAKRGVDVKIVTPHIPDKAYVHIMTQSYYPQLIEAGVKVYEYTPGFIHSKTFVADNQVAVIGTINMDYRSLYHHYECATVFYENTTVHALTDDFNQMLKVCTEITLQQCNQIPLYKRIARGFMKIISPLM